MIFSSFAVFADAFDEYYNICGTEATSADYDMSFSTELTVSEGFFEAVNSELQQNSSPFYIDMQKLLESACKTTVDANVKLNASDSYDKIQAAVNMKTNIPLVITENLSVNVDAGVTLWVNYDFSDVEKPVFQITILHPFSDKYLYIDVLGMLEENVEGFDAEKVRDGVCDFFEMCVDDSEYADKLKQAIKDNCSVSRTGNDFNISINGEQYNELVLDCIEVVAEMFDDFCEGHDIEMTMSELFGTDDIRAFYEETLNGFSFLGEDGIQMTIETDGKKPLKATTKENIEMNLYDLMTSSGSIIGAATPFTKDNSTISYTSTSVITYNSINEPVEITYPLLTEENSFDLLNDEFDNGYDYAPTFNYEVYSDGLAIHEDGRIFVPFDAAMNEFTEYYGGTFDLNAAAGTITVTVSDDSDIIDVFVMSSASINTATGEVTVKYKDAEREDKHFNCFGQLKSFDGVMYCSDAFLCELFDGTFAYDSYEFDNHDGSYYTNLSFRFELYYEPVEADPIPTPDTEKTPVLFYIINSKALPVQEGTLSYLPIDAVLEQFVDDGGSFEVLENGNITFTAPADDSRYIFSDATADKASDTVTVNYKDKDAESKTYAYNGMLKDINGTMHCSYYFTECLFDVMFNFTNVFFDESTDAYYIVLYYRRAENSSPTEEENDDYYYPEVSFEGLAIHDEDTAYLPLRNSLYAFGLTEENIVWTPDNGGTITITNPNTIDNMIYDTVVIANGAMTVTTLGESATLPADGIKLVDGTTYISVELIEGIASMSFAYEYYDYDYELGNYVSSFVFERVYG